MTTNYKKLFPLQQTVSSLIAPAFNFFTGRQICPASFSKHRKK